MPGRVRIGARGMTIEEIASILPIANFNGAVLDRPVLDRTGLTGKYNFSLEWTPEFNGINGMPPPSFQPDPTGPTFLEALKEQLGVRLEPTTGPIDAFVIDHIEEPSPN